MSAALYNSRESGCPLPASRSPLSGLLKEVPVVDARPCRGPVSGTTTFRRGSAFLPAGKSVATLLPAPRSPFWAQGHLQGPFATGRNPFANASFLRGGVLAGSRLARRPISQINAFSGPRRPGQIARGRSNCQTSANLWEIFEIHQNEKRESGSGGHRAWRANCDSRPFRSLPAPCSPLS